MPDFLIADHGSIVWIVPVTDAARRWLEENTVSEPWQWLNGALCVDNRLARDLVAEIEAAGLNISC